MRNHIRPHMSEKSVALAAQGTYTFDVPLESAKQQILADVSAQYQVTALDARVVITKGKVKRSYLKRQRPLNGKRSDQKKAYVVLKKGDKIDAFEETT
jgi:large subunit ribosomal protein L23